jgi:hypothetical protein
MPATLNTNREFQQPLSNPSTLNQTLNPKPQNLKPQTLNQVTKARDLALARIEALGRQVAAAEEEQRKAEEEVVVLHCRVDSARDVVVKLMGSSRPKGGVAGEQRDLDAGERRAVAASQQSRWLVAKLEETLVLGRVRAQVCALCCHTRACVLS